MSLLLYNGKIATLDEGGRYVEAIGMSDGRIDFLGTTALAIERFKFYKETVDLDGKLVLPGFNDSHLHVLGYGMTKNMLMLHDYGSIEEIITGAKGYIVKKGLCESDILLGRGWNQDLYPEARMITRSDLDKISSTIPIVMKRVCGHKAVANSALIEKLDILEVLKNENVDIENGYFEEDALEILNKLVDKPSVDQIALYIKSACKELLSYGITSVQTDDFSALSEEDYQMVIDAYEYLVKTGDLPLRVYHQSLLPTEELFRAYLKKGYRTGMGNEWFKFGPLKLLLDGSLGNRTAKLLEEYQDKPNGKGITVYNQEGLNRMVKIAEENDNQVAIHAIGDQAIIMTLDAFEASDRIGNNSLRHGVVHCQLTNNQIIDRLSKQSILAYIQPIFLDYDMSIVGKRIGEERSKSTYAFKTMLDKGIKVSGGSDAPVVHFNIFDNIYSAVTRKNLKGIPQNGWMPEEKLTVDEAIELFTKNGAYASFEEDLKGSLELGKLADLVVLNKDIYVINQEEIRTCKVLYTIVNGRIAYENIS